MHRPNLETSSAALRQAERLDLLSAAIACDFGALYYLERRFDETIEHCRKALDLHPTFHRTYVFLARALTAKGNNAAIHVCSKAWPHFTGRAFLGQLLATLGYSYARSGDAAAALGTLAELDGIGRHHFASSLDRAAIYCGLGDADRALHLLETAVAEREFWVMSLPTEPLFDPLREHSGFQAILQHISTPILDR